MLLRLRVANHRSVRDAIELSLVSSELRGARPANNDWTASTNRVAGIYGANASGKSNVLDSLNFLVTAVRNSATVWGDREDFPYRPFGLDDTSAKEPSHYEIDFVLDEVRHSYGFLSSSSGIHEEWLYTYPTGRRRVLFERNGFEAKDIDFGRTLSGENQRIARLLRPTALYLSTAANSNHKTLAPIQHWLSRHIKYARYSDADRAARLRWVRNVLEKKQAFRRAIGLVRFADLGISDLILNEKALNDEEKAFLARILESIPGSGRATLTPSELEVAFQDAAKQITFLHAGENSGETFPLSLEQESSGTVAWLALGVPALEAIRRGEVFVVDELDASLHPRLAAALINMFRDQALNDKGAQLIFTSHETSLLGPLLGETLSREEVWFTEKRSDGSTDLYSLNEFSVRSSDNVERRYLQGRYGAVPVIAPEEIRAAISCQA